MVQVRTSPEEHSLLVLEARKSCSFGIHFSDSTGNPLDVSTSSVTLSVAPQNRASGSAPLLSVAAETRPDIGWKRFNIQATQLNLAVGQYDFAVTMILEGYSFVVMKGTLELVDNTDVSATASTFTIPSTTTNLKVALKPAAAVVVSLSNMILPIPTASGGGGGGGTPTPVTDAELTAIFESGASTLRAAIAAMIDAKIAEIPTTEHPTNHMLKSDGYAVRRRQNGGTGNWEPANRGEYAGIIWVGTDPSSTEQLPGDLRLVPEGV